MTELNKRLYKAVCNDDIEEIERLLNEGANAEMVEGSSNNTLVHLTSNVKVIRLLVSFGANLIVKNWNGHNALHHAIVTGKGLEVIRELLNVGSNVNFKTLIGITALELAVEKGADEDTEILTELIEAGADIVTYDFYRRSKDVVYALFPHDLVQIAFDHGFIKSASLLAKYHTLKSFRKDAKDKVIRQKVDDWTDEKLVSLRQDCLAELKQMDKEVICGIHLTEIILPNRQMYFYNSLSWKLAKRNYSKYVIYNDIILKRIIPAVQRVELLTTLRNIRVAVPISDDNYIELNADCKELVADKLLNDDLAHFIEALNDLST